MRTFKLHRKTDISGLSGTGDVGEGVELHDGQCVLSWFGRFHNIEIFRTAKELLAIHGHGGCTVIKWDTVPVSSGEEYNES